jgi:hypothetical protein
VHGPADAVAAEVGADPVATRAPDGAGTAAAMPARSASLVTSISRASGGRGAPMVNETAASAVQPSSTAPQSTLSRSPSASLYRPGMPCRAASLTEVQMVAGNGTGAKPGW